MARTRLSSMSLSVKVVEIPLPTTCSQQSLRLPMPYSQLQRQLAAHVAHALRDAVDGQQPGSQRLESGGRGGGEIAGAARSAPARASGSGYRLADQ